jgi:hypothetical protein
MAESMKAERAELAERHAERSAERAGDLLTFYLRRATEAAGARWDGDNEGEIRDAVGHIVDAARSVATAVTLRES